MLFCILCLLTSNLQVGKERALGFDPLCVSHFNSGDYLLLGGSNRQVIMYTKEGNYQTIINFNQLRRSQIACNYRESTLFLFALGIQVGVVAEQDSWVWCCKANPDGSRVVS